MYQWLFRDAIIYLTHESITNPLRVVDSAKMTSDDDDPLLTLTNC